MSKPQFIIDMRGITTISEQLEPNLTFLNIERRFFTLGGGAQYTVHDFKEFIQRKLYLPALPFSIQSDDCPTLFFPSKKSTYYMVIRIESENIFYFLVNFQGSIGSARLYSHINLAKYSKNNDNFIADIWMTLNGN